MLFQKEELKFDFFQKKVTIQNKFKKFLRRILGNILVMTSIPLSILGSYISLNDTITNNTNFSYDISLLLTLTCILGSQLFMLKIIKNYNEFKLIEEPLILSSISILLSILPFWLSHMTSVTFH